MAVTLQESVLKMGAEDSSLILRMPGFQPGFTLCVLEQITYCLSDSVFSSVKSGVLTDPRRGGCGEN